MHTPSPPPSPSPASLLRPGSANEYTDHVADHPAGPFIKHDECATPPDQAPKKPVQDDCNPWGPAGSRVKGLDILEVASNSSEAIIHCGIDYPQVEQQLTTSEWNPVFGLGPEANVFSGGGAVDVGLPADLSLCTTEALGQDQYTVPQPPFPSDAVGHNCFNGPANNPPSMGIQDGHLNTPFGYTDVQAANLPIGYQAYAVQNEMNWGASFEDFGQTTSMQPFPAFPSNFSNTGIPFGYPIPQRTPCAWPMCSESFARQSDLQRHMDSVHLGIKHHCFWPGCSNNRGNGYCRLEKLRTHQKQKHGYAFA